MKLRDKDTKKYLLTVFVATFVAYIIPAVVLYLGYFMGIMLTICISLFNLSMALLAWLWAKSVRKEFLLKRQIILNSLVTLLLIGIISLVVTNGAALSLNLIVFVWGYSISCQFVSSMPFILLFQKEPVPTQSHKTTKTNSFMIEKIMSKLGMVVLWCIVIIYGIGVITHICSDIIGVVVLVILAVISIIFVLYANRYKILFKRQVKMLSTICEKSSDDSHIMHEEQLTESFDSANFFVSYKSETKEFFFCSYYYFIFPDYVKTWSKAVKEIQALVSKEAPKTKVEVNSVGQIGKDFTLIMSPKDAKKSFLLSLAHLCIRLRSQLPCNNKILIYKFYFKIKVFDTICYGEFDGVRVSKAITISVDGNYCVANVEIDGCFPEDFIKLNPPMSIILQYDLYSIETNMLISKEEFDAHWEKCKELCES